MPESSNKFYLTPFNLPQIIAALEKEEISIKISPDLNLSTVLILLDRGGVSLGGKLFSKNDLMKLGKKLSGILLIENGVGEKLEIFAGNYLKLKPTAFAPTVEIDGIQMHRTKEMDPWEDSRRKVMNVVKPGDNVLDTCGGLGYTAIWALKLHAECVTTVEKNPAMIEIQKKNPHSRLLNDSKIIRKSGDIFHLIQTFKDSGFDSVIHDPPRFSLAGELYGQDFYNQLCRVMKHSGRIFHYVGDPYSKGRGRGFIEGVIKRLKTAGFKTKNDKENLGVIGEKIIN